MLLEGLFKESDRLQIYQLDLESKKVVSHRDVEALFELKFIVDDALGT